MEKQTSASAIATEKGLGGDNQPDTPIVVDWVGENDPGKPANWSPLRQWLFVISISVITNVTCLATTIFAPVVPHLMQEFHSQSSELASFVVSVYLIGFASGPLISAPLSELYGRLPAIYGSVFLFIVFNICCAVSVNLPMLIVFRLLAGFAGCAPLAIGGSMVADVMSPAKRGKAMGIWSSGPLVGPIIGPVIGGYAGEALGWRWMFWLTAIFMAFSVLVSVPVLRESYAPILLERRALDVRKRTGARNVSTIFDVKRDINKPSGPGAAFLLAIVRPSKMLLKSPIVGLLGLVTGVAYSYGYLLFTTYPLVFPSIYHFNLGETGLAYLGIGIGFVIGIAGCNAFTSRLHRRRAAAAEKMPTPEQHLPPLILGSFLLPIGLFWYGWSAEAHAHWAVPLIGTLLIGIGIIAIWLPIQLYLVETFTVYAASALASNMVIRSVLGGLLPLCGRQMYAKLGLGWGNSLLGFIALLALPMPFILLRWGSQIRTSKRFEIKL